MINRKLNTEEFIKLYKLAVKNKFNIEELSMFLNIKRKSLLKRRSEIKREIGMSLPMLNNNDSINTDKFEILENEFNDIINNQPQPLEKSYNSKRFVITSAQNATPIHQGFFKSLLTFCKENNAQLLVIPFRYKNPTSIWSQNNQKDSWWHKSLLPYLLEEDIELNKSIKILGSIKIQPTAIEPLSGFDGYTGDKSSILGHPRIQLKTVATPNNILPKILSTTGAVTIKNYTDSTAGFKGHFNHSLAAAVVEIEGDAFYMRHIHASDDNGYFYDLDKKYCGDKIIKDQKILALITGDSHVEFMDEKVESATYTSPDSLMKKLKPEYLVFHDIIDFYSRNHHERHNDITNYAKHHLGRNNVESNLQQAADFIDRVSDPNTINVIVKSNHDEAFDRWLREIDIKTDPENARFYYYMKYNQVKNVEITDTGFSTIDPFEFWCNNPDMERGLSTLKNTIFLKRNQSFLIRGIEVGMHGDIGINGTRGSSKSLNLIGTKSIIGHSHSPSIYGGCYQVGVSAKLNLSYNIGPSSWMHSHCIIYPDGKRTLIHIVKGKWTTSFD